MNEKTTIRLLNALIVFSSFAATALWTWLLFFRH